MTGTATSNQRRVEYVVGTRTKAVGMPVAARDRVRWAFYPKQGCIISCSNARVLCGAPQRAARLPDDWGVWLHLKIIILKGIDFSSCWSAIRHLKPPGPQISCRIPAYARRGGWEGIQQKVLDIRRDIRPMHGTARNADHA